MAEPITGETFSIGQSAKETGDDLSLAGIIAQAVRAVPGVYGMSQGRFALAATYGPGGRVPGVVLWHEAPGRLLIEVHIVASETLLLAAFQCGQTKASSSRPALLQLAEQVRVTVQQVVMRFNIFPQTIDVVIEDTC